MRLSLRLPPVFLAVLSFGAAWGAEPASASGPVVAHWTFDGDCRDGSGWDRHLDAKGARFVPGPRGQALAFEQGSVSTPGSPELELAPGLRVECWVSFPERPGGYDPFVGKKGEYMLRVDPISEGGHFSFFVHLNGSWEPRVRSSKPMVPGIWYHLVAEWDGETATLEVNGERASVARSGWNRPAGAPLEIGVFGGVIDELRIDNPVMRHPRAKAADLRVAAWGFDGGLADGSGRGHDVALAAPRFVPGREGQALLFGGESGLVPHGPDFALSPNLRIECQVRLEEESTDYRPIVTKDGEYLLRVDSRPEGGHFSFFVNQGGSWGPKARSAEPAKTGVWYHLVAYWDGFDAVLEVNGERSRMRRSGSPSSGEQPVGIGSPGMVIDALTIENPTALALHELRAMVTAVPAGDRAAGEHFGQGAGWPGWVGRGEARVSLEEDVLEAALDDADAMIVHPAMDLDVTQRKFVCCDVLCQSARSARLMFVTEAGHGTADVPLWSDPRTSVVDLAAEPNWRGRLKLLAISVPGVRAHKVQLENLWISDRPVGKPFLSVRNLAQGRALLRAGRPETLVAVVQSLGMEAKEATARLVLPEGVRCTDGAVRELGTMPTGMVKTAEWTLVADTEVSGNAEVALAAAGSALPPARCRLAFRPAETPWQALVPPKGGAGGAAYYIDSREGSNANSGRSPDSAWQDFAHINGKTLGPGEKLLIRRGSVINQELQVSAAGTAENWAEIGPYGAGPRPIVRRNWDIRDRCALVTNPDYLWIHGLVVTRAGKGLVVSYTKSGHAGLLIEDCVASHIEGLYLPDNHGIPEWMGLRGAPGDSCRSPGFAVVGAAARHLTIRDCEIFHTSQGFRVSQSGEPTVIDRVYCHGCYAHNTSPHPVLTGGTLVQNSVFDASGGHASRGTMGIMLGGPRGLTFRNCTFRNMPDSGSHDQGGIDFEAGGDGCLIDRCTFENNAGAGIEVLGLKSPQCRNIEIRNSRFIKNNWVKKSHGPAEIYVWGSRNPDPKVCCSTGIIHSNGYVLLPGVEFFVNAAPELTWWTLRDNVAYATAEGLRAAMPFNEPPIVDAGPDLHVDGSTARLEGRVSDDGRPAGSPLKMRWEVLDGPGEVAFADEASPTTAATFAQPGDYLLRLVGDDGELWLSDMVDVHVLSKGATVATAWEFNRQLDKQGWTEADLGTRERRVGVESYQVAKPVKYVSGGFYIVAVEESTDARLLSPDNLDLDLAGHGTVAIRFQNRTPATRMRFAFTTGTATEWDDANGASFAVVPNDNGPRLYAVDMSAVPGWTGKLRQLRLDLATGTSLTGTCRIDYIRIDSTRR